MSGAEIASRVESLDWPRIASDLDAYGCAVARGVLDPEQCHALAAMYGEDEPFRSRIVMAGHGVSRLRSGRRHTLGVIFHDAK